MPSPWARNHNILFFLNIQKVLHQYSDLFFLQKKSYVWWYIKQSHYFNEKNTNKSSFCWVCFVVLFWFSLILVYFFIHSFLYEASCIAKQQLRLILQVPTRGLVSTGLQLQRGQISSEASKCLSIKPCHYEHPYAFVLLWSVNVAATAQLSDAYLLLDLWEWIIRLSSSSYFTSATNRIE